MPQYKKTKHNKFPRRRFAKRYRKRHVDTRTLICRTIGGTPDRYFTKFAVSYTKLFSFNGTGFQQWRFKINSLILPIGFGQYCSGLANWLGSVNYGANATGLYQNYICHGCSIVADYNVVTTASAATTVYPKIVIAPLGLVDSAYAGNIDALIETPGAVWKALQPTTTGTNVTMNRLRKAYSIKELEGIPRKLSLRSIDELEGNYTNDPVKTWYGIIAMATDQAGDTDNGLQIAVALRIVYTVELYNRNPINMNAPN